MERLTKELWDGCTIEEFSHFVELDGVESKTVGNGWAHPVVVGKSIDRLAAYEDTEHTPDDLQMMIRSYDAIKSELTAYRNTELSPEQIQAQQQEIEQLKALASYKTQIYEDVIDKMTGLIQDKDQQTGTIMRYEAMLKEAQQHLTKY